MSVVLRCPSCKQIVAVTEASADGEITCPHCSTTFSEPAPRLSAGRVEPRASGAVPAPRDLRFTFACQRCGSILETRGDLGGKRGRCPTCGAVFAIPNVDPHTGLAKGPAIVQEDGQLPTPMHAYATAGEKAPTIRRREDGGQVIVCPRCERNMPVDAETCAACGMPFTMEGAQAVIPAGAERNGFATAALTVGIISVATPCVPGLGLVAVGLGIAGVRRAGRFRLAGAASGRNMAIVGTIFGIVAVVENLVVFF